MSWVSSERWEEWEGEWGREQGNWATWRYYNPWCRLFDFDVSYRFIVNDMLCHGHNQKKVAAECRPGRTSRIQKILCIPWSRKCPQIIHHLVSGKWTQTNCGLYRRLESSSAVYAFTKLFPSKTLARSIDRMCLGMMNHRFIWSQECSTRARDNLINCTTNLGDIGVVRVLFRTQYTGDASRLKDEEVE